jgi:hypothetical protein
MRSSNIVKRTLGGGMQMLRRSCAAGIEQCCFFFLFLGGRRMQQVQRLFPRLCSLLMDWLPECSEIKVFKDQSAHG